MQKQSHSKKHTVDSSLDMNEKVLKFIQEKSRFAHSFGGYHTQESSKRKWSENENHKDFYAVVPPLDRFMCVNREEALDYVWNGFQNGDVVIGRISSMHEHGLSMLLLALDGGKSRDIEKLKIHAWCPIIEIPKETNHEDVLLRFNAGELLRCVIAEKNYEDQELVVSMFPPRNFFQNVTLGHVEDENLPVAYQRQLSSDDPYEHVLELSVGFVNPNNVEYLMSKLGIPNEELVSLMRGLHKRHCPKEDYAEPLRKHQCKKYAERSVKRGVEKFRANNYMEALQDFNHALDIDTENVDGLVARGALYANRSSFLRAVNDFEGAIKLEPTHKNAKKYLIEVLVARAKQIENQMSDVQQVKEVERCYRRALQLDHDCEEAKKALGEIETMKENKREEERSKNHSRKATRKNSNSSCSSSSPESNAGTYAATAEKLRQMLKNEPVIKKRTLSNNSTKSKGQRQKVMKKNSVSNERNSKKCRDSSSSSSERSESSSSSSSSSSSTSSSSSDSSSESDRGKKKKRKERSASSSSSSSSGDERIHKQRKHSHRHTNISEQPVPNVDVKSRRRSSNNPIVKLQDKSNTKHESNATRRKSSSSVVSNSSSKYSTSYKTSNRHATIRSDYAAQDRSPLSKSKHEKQFNDSRISERRHSANLAKITKDNFKDILNEISKFEKTGGEKL